MSPFQAWWMDAVPVTRFWTEFVEIPRAISFCVEQRLLRDLELVLVLRVEVQAVDQVRLADRLLEVVEDEHPPSPSGFVRSFHEPVIP